MAYRKKMSTEEFGDFVFKITEKDIEYEKSIDKIISDSRKLYNAARNANISKEEFENYKKIYVNILLKYGFDYKKNESDGRTAKMLFVNALEVNPNLARANYRVGHILFKQNKYAEAIMYFDKAIKQMESGHSEKYALLDKEQMINAKKVIAYCALTVFNGVKNDSLKGDKYPELDKYIEEHVYHIKMKVIGEDEVRLISNDEYEDILERNSCVILDKYAKEPSIHFNQKNINSFNFSFLKDIIEDNLDDVREYISSKNSNGHISENSLNQKIKRLREKLEYIGLYDKIFSIKKSEKYKAIIETSLPIIIFSRIEDN